MGMEISVRDFGSQLRSGNAAYVVVWCVLIFPKKTLQQRRGLRSPLARVGRARRETIGSSATEMKRRTGFLMTCR